VGSRSATFIGRPYIAGATVTVSLEESLKDAKVIIFKKRRRKHSQRLNGYRRQISVVRIESIDFGREE
jgi:large subunit ribosomal protein L21